MSAPTTHDPLVVNTRDGECWERRAVTDSGLGLYAVKGSCKCPPFKMATLAELAERGIAGSADVLPVPVGPVPQASERDRLRAAYIVALDAAHKTHPCPTLGDQLWSGCVHYDDAGHVSGVGSCHSERRADAVLAVRDVEMEQLRAQVAELNESLTSAAEALRARPSCPCPPADQPGPHQLGCPLAEVPLKGRARLVALRQQGGDLTPRAAPQVVQAPHDGPLAHRYRVGHDLDVPGTGGAL